VQREAVVEDARHAWNAAKLLDRGSCRQNKSQRDWRRSLRHAIIVLVQNLPISVMLHDLQNVADAEA
jgi:hypothetical protein